MNKLFNFTQAKGKWHKFPSFNLGGGAKLYKNFAQKLLAVSLCAAMVLLGVPLGGQSVHVAAAAGESTIPNTLFLTKADLLALCEETNRGTGLLATGTDTDVKLRINFGTRPEEAVYYYDGWATANRRTAFAGPITWLIAGGEKFTPAGHSEETDGLVLYSEEPLVSAYKLRGGSKMNSIFQTDEPADVYANHWGESNLRRVLTAIYKSSTLGEGDETADYSGFFNATETGLMAASAIKTNNHQTGSAVGYTTTDVLYAPRYNSSQVLSNWENADKITVGGADTLSIDKAHWGGLSWLRSPHPRYDRHALFALPVYGVNSIVNFGGLNSDALSISAAFRLDLSDVLFTSAASAGTGFSALDPNTPMTLRLDGSDQNLGTATLSLDKSAVSLAGANGSTLMVQGVTDDGHNWSYSKAIESDSFTTVSAAQVAAAGATGLTSFDDCEVWLEKPVESGGTLTYAVRAEETLPVSVTGVSLSETTRSLAVGESFDLTAKISPEDATNKAVKWTSSEPTVASVDENGTVKALKAGTTTITVTTADGAKTATCVVTVTEASAGPAYLEATVDVKGQQQRLRVYDPNGVLPDGTKFEALAVTEHEHLDDDHEIEHLLAYDLSLLDASGNPLHMPLDAPVELCFEVLDGLDKNELEVVLVQQFDDREFDEELIVLEGSTWVKVKTDHFSPYALIDRLSAEEKAARNVPTGDQAAQMAVSGLGMVLVLALGVMLRLITGKKKFEE